MATRPEHLLQHIRRFASVIRATVEAARAWSAGEPVPGVSSEGTNLVEGTLKSTAVPKRKVAPGVLFLTSVFTAGAGMLAQSQLAAQQTDPRAAAKASEPTKATEQLRADRYGDPLPPGARARLGTVRFRHGNPISEVRFSADGKTLVSRGWHQSVSFWDPATGKELRRVLVQRDQQLLVLSPDGKFLATCKEKGGPISLREMTTGKVLRQFDGDPGPILTAAFSPDGHILAAAAQDATVRFWSVATGKELRRTAPQPDQIMRLAFAPDGKTLVSGRSDGTITLWQTATGRQLRSLEKKGRFVSAIAISPDCKLMAWGNTALENGQIWLWDITTDKEVRHLKGHPKQIGGLAFSPDGKYLVSGGGSDDGSVRLWDVATGRKVWQTAAHSNWPVAFAFSPDGKTLASGSTDGTVGVWDVATGKDLRPPTQGHFAAVNGLALSPDGRTLASGGWDRTIRLWNPATGKELRQLSGHTDTVFRLAFSPDGRLLASASFDGSVRLWDPATGKELHFLQGQNGYAFTVTFSPDGRTLASGGADGTVRLWNPANGKELVQLKGPQQGIHGAAFSPDGRLLAGSSYDGATHLWEIASGKELLQLRGHEHTWVHCVTFSPDGRTLASGSEDRTIRLWDVKTGEERGRLTGHEALVSCLAFTTDGRTLISTSYDQTIRLWELASGKERHQFRVDRGWPRTVVLAPDCRTLYSSGDDSTLLVWNLHDPASNDLPPARELTTNQERALWTDLQSMDAQQAFRAESALIAIPEKAVALLRERLRPAANPDAKRLGRLLDELDSSEFPVRIKAEAELEALGDLAETALRKTLEGRPSLEVRRRAERLLKKLEGTIAGPEKLRILRALEVLEQIGTPGAVRVLKIMSGGADEASVTREAKASLQRLDRRSPLRP